MALNVNSQQIEIVFKAKDEASNIINRIGASLTNAIDQAASGFERTFVAAGAAVAAGIGLMASEATAFEDKMRQVSAIVGTSGDNLAALSKVALDFARDTRFTANEASDAMKVLAQFGIKDAKVMNDLVRSIGDVSTVMRIDMPKAAELVIAQFKIFEKTGITAREVADKLTAAWSNSSLNALKLATGLSKVAPAASLFGHTLDDILPLLAALTDRGQDARVAGNALKFAFVKLAAPTDKAAAALAGMAERLGVTIDRTRRADETAGEWNKRMKLLNKEIAQRFNPETRKMIDILEDMKTAQITNAEAADILRVRSGPLIKLLSQETKSVHELAAAFANSDTAAEIAAEQLKTLTGALLILQGSIQVTMVEAFTPFLKDIALIVTWIKEVVNGFLEGARATNLFQESATAIIDSMRKLLVAITGTEHATARYYTAVELLVAGYKEAVRYAVIFLDFLTDYITALRMADKESGGLSKTLDEIGGVIRIFIDLLSIAVKTVTRVSLALVKFSNLPVAERIQYLTEIFKDLWEQLKLTAKGVTDAWDAFDSADFGSFFNLGSEITKFLTALISAAGALKAFGSLMAWVPGFIIAFQVPLSALGVVLTTVAGAFTTLGSVMGAWGSSVLTILTVIGLLPPGISQLVSALFTLIATTLILKTAWENNFLGIQNIWAKFVEIVTKNKGLIISTFSDITKFVGDSMKDIGSFILGTGDTFALFEFTLNTLLLTVEKVFAGIVNYISGDTEVAIASFKDAWLLSMLTIQSALHLTGKVIADSMMAFSRFVADNEKQIIFSFRLIVGGIVRAVDEIASALLGTGKIYDFVTVYTEAFADQIISVFKIILKLIQGDFPGALAEFQNLWTITLNGIRAMLAVFVGDLDASFAKTLFFDEFIRAADNFYRATIYVFAAIGAYLKGDHAAALFALNTAWRLAYQGIKNTLAGLVETVFAALKIIQNAIKNNRGIIITEFGFLLDGIQQFITRFSQMFLGTGAIYQAVIATTRFFAEELKIVFAIIINILSGDVNGALTGFRLLFENTFQNLPALLNIYVQALLQAFTLAQGYLAAHSAAITGTFAGIVDTLRTYIDQFVGIFIGGTEVYTHFLTASTAFGETLKGLFNALFALITGDTNKAMNLLKGVYYNALETIKSILLTAITAMGAIFSSLVEYITNNIPAIQGAFDGMIEAIAGKFLELGTRVLAGTGYLADYKALIEGFSSGAKEIFAALLAFITGDFSGAFEHVKNAWTASIEGLWPILIKVKDFFITTWNEIILHIQENAPRYGQIILDALTNMILGLGTVMFQISGMLIQGIQIAFADLVSWITGDGSSQIVTALSTIGAESEIDFTNLLNALSMSLQLMWETFKAAARVIFVGIIDVFDAVITTMPDVIYRALPGLEIALQSMVDYIVNVIGSGANTKKIGEAFKALFAILSTIAKTLKKPLNDAALAIVNGLAAFIVKYGPLIVAAAAKISKVFVEAISNYFQGNGPETEWGKAVQNLAAALFNIFFQVAKIVASRVGEAFKSLKDSVRELMSEIFKLMAGKGSIDKVGAAFELTAKKVGLLSLAFIYLAGTHMASFLYRVVRNTTAVGGAFLKLGILIEAQTGIWSKLKYVMLAPFKAVSAAISLFTTTILGLPFVVGGVMTSISGIVTGTLVFIVKAVLFSVGIISAAITGIPALWALTWIAIAKITLSAVGTIVGIILGIPLLIVGAFAAGAANVIGLIAGIIVAVELLGTAMVIMKVSWDKDVKGTQTILQKFLDWTETLFYNLLSILSTTMDRVRYWLVDHLEQILGESSVILQIISTAMKRTQLAILFSVDAIRKAIGGDFKGAWARLKDAWEQSLMGITGVLHILQEFIQNFVVTLRGYIVTEGDKIFTGFLEPFNKMVPAVEQALTRVQLTIGRVIGIISALFKGEWKLAYTNALLAVEFAFDAIEALWEGAVQTVTTYLTLFDTEITAGINKIISGISMGAAALIQGLSVIVQDGLKLIITMFSDLDDAGAEGPFRKLITTIGNAFIEGFRLVGLSVIKAVNDIGPLLLDAFATVFETVLTWMDAPFEQLMTKGKDKILELLKGLGSYLRGEGSTQLGVDVNSAWGKALALFPPLFDTLWKYLKEAFKFTMVVLGAVWEEFLKPGLKLLWGKFATYSIELLGNIKDEVVKALEKWIKPWEGAILAIFVVLASTIGAYLGANAVIMLAIFTFVGGVIDAFNGFEGDLAYILGIIAGLFVAWKFVALVGPGGPIMIAVMLFVSLMTGQFDDLESSITAILITIASVFTTWKLVGILSPGGAILAGVVVFVGLMTGHFTDLSTGIKAALTAITVFIIAWNVKFLLALAAGFGVAGAPYILIAAFLAFIVIWWKELKAIWKAVYDYVVEWVKDLSATIQELKKIAPVFNWMVTKMEWVVGKFLWMYKKLMGINTEYKSKFVDGGKETADAWTGAIEQGILSGEEDIEKAIYKAMASKMQTASPSPAEGPLAGVEKSALIIGAGYSENIASGITSGTAGVVESLKTMLTSMFSADTTKPAAEQAKQAGKAIGAGMGEGMEAAMLAASRNAAEQQAIILAQLQNNTDAKLNEIAQKNKMAQEQLMKLIKTQQTAAAGGVPTPTRGSGNTTPRQIPGYRTTRTTQDESNTDVFRGAGNYGVIDARQWQAAGNSLGTILDRMDGIQRNVVERAAETYASRGSGGGGGAYGGTFSNGAQASNAMNTIINNNWGGQNLSTDLDMTKWTDAANNIVINQTRAKYGLGGASYRPYSG